MFIDYQPLTPSYPKTLLERNFQEKTFLKTIKKGELNVQVYFDKQSIFLVTFDTCGNEIDFEKRDRTLAFLNQNSLH